MAMSQITTWSSYLGIFGVSLPHLQGRNCALYTRSVGNTTSSQYGGLPGMLRFQGTNGRQRADEVR